VPPCPSESAPLMPDINYALSKNDNEHTKQCDVKKVYTNVQELKPVSIIVSELQSIARSVPTAEIFLQTTETSRESNGG